MNWGMIPFQFKGNPNVFEVDDWVYVPDIKSQLDGDTSSIDAYVIRNTKYRKIQLWIDAMTPEEREIVKAGCLINYNRNKR